MCDLKLLCGLGLSASMRTSSRSPTPSGRIQMDEHKQLKEADRPEEQANSSDPDTSLYEYEDDRLVTKHFHRIGLLSDFE